MSDRENEDDLDDLDSLLDELEDDILSKPPGSQAETKTGGSHAEGSKPVLEADAGANGEDKNIEDEFTAMMADIQQKDPSLANQLSEFMKELAQDESIVDQSAAPKAGAAPAEAPTEAPNGSKNFEDIVADTINRLKTSGEDVDRKLKEEQTAASDPLSQLLAQLGDMNLDDLGLNTDDADGEDGLGGGIGGVLMDMLSQLTSKSVLYDPLKDLHGKFPAWLERNEASLDKAQHENYAKQYKVIDEIIVKFEDADYDDKKDSNYINARLETLQNLGMPPEEIMNGELGQLPGFNSGAGAAGVDIGDEQLPQDIEKQLDENCKQS